MLKVVILGSGTISSVHVNGWKNIEGAELCAIFDQDSSKMEKYPDIRHYTDFDGMIDRDDISHGIFTSRTEARHPCCLRKADISQSR